MFVFEGQQSFERKNNIHNIHMAEIPLENWSESPKFLRIAASFAEKDLRVELFYVSK